MPPRRSLAALTAVLALPLVALALPAGPAEAATGHITYRIGEGQLMRVEAKAGARPQDVSAGLDRKFPGGGDQFLNQSPDGSSLVLVSERFGCSGYPCLAVVSSDLRTGTAVRGGNVHPEGFSAVGDSGRVVVWPQQSSGGRVDLFVSRKGRGGWSAPRNVTARAPQAIHGLPAISSDGRKVLHDCGDANDPSQGTLSVCETRLDGSGTTVRVKPGDGRRPQDPVFGAGSLHHGDYLTGRPGGIVFESQWCCAGESIWFRGKGRGARPQHVAGASGNNVAPCGLPGGRVVSLELSRRGVHELMVTSPTSRTRTYVLPAGTDVADIGLGCGR